MSDITMPLKFLSSQMELEPVIIPNDQVFPVNQDVLLSKILDFSQGILASRIVRSSLTGGGNWVGNDE